MFGLFQKQPPVEPPLPPIPNVWPPTQVSESGPRPVQFTSNTKLGLGALRLTSILIIVIGIPIVLNRASMTERLARQGEVVQAKVVDLTVSRGKSTSYYVEYLYDYGGASVYDDKSVSQGEYESLTVGNRVPVTVLPSDPYVHRYGLVTEEDARSQQWQGSLLAMVLSGLVGVGALAFRSHARGQQAKLENWLARPAQAIHLESKSAGKSGTTHTIRYRVLMPNHRIEEFIDSRTGNGGPSAQPGDLFTAMLNPEDESEACPLWSLTTVEIAPNALV